MLVLSTDIRTKGLTSDFLVVQSELLRFKLTSYSSRLNDIIGSSSTPCRRKRMTEIMSKKCCFFIVRSDQEHYHYPP